MFCLFLSKKCLQKSSEANIAENIKIHIEKSDIFQKFCFANSFNFPVL